MQKSQHRAGILLILAAGIATSTDAGIALDTDLDPKNMANADASQALTSTGAGAHFKAAAGADTFCLYGGPGSLEGKFQDINGIVPDAQGWFGVDLTDRPNLWQLSTFCASNLNDGGPGNTAVWAGQSALQEPGWATPPGYGNSWNEFIEWRATVSNPSVAQTVRLDFDFNHDTEPTYDFFNVEYDSSQTTINVYQIDGTNHAAGLFPVAPGVQFDTTLPPAPGLVHQIVFSGNDYSGPGNDEIVIRLLVTSDGGWSDEDGMWPTLCGAVQADNINVNYNDGSSAASTFDDFESGFGNWTPKKAPFVGDFSAVYARITDTDPCRENKTPVIGFLDTGQCPKNPDNNFGNPPCDVATVGGTTSPNVNYGVPGSFVVNYNGGLTNNVLSLRNQFWSPEIDWDLPGTEDDGIDVSGAFIRFSVWRDLPLRNGMFYQWHVRSQEQGTGIWTSMVDRNFVYFGGDTGEWLNSQIDVSDLLTVRPAKVQIALTVFDSSGFPFEVQDSTPSPVYDNASFSKFRIGGPALATRQIDLFNDSFPQSGETDFHTLAGRQNAAIRVDMARDTSTGTINSPGDSLICDVVAVIPGSSIVQTGMNVIIDKNPKFDDVRDAIAGATTVVGGATNGWDQCQFTVLGQPSTAAGQVVENRFFYDIPDGGKSQIPVPSGSRTFFPGDVMRYYLWATDDGGRSTTLPSSTVGFATGSVSNSSYNRTFVVRGLPSVVDDGAGGWTRPWILFVNDFGRRGGEDEYLWAFSQNHWQEGVAYDSYTVQGPSSSVSNGIGSSGAHGATADQLADYEVIIYVSGDLTSTIMSDGSNDQVNDKGDDLGTISGWFNGTGDKAFAIFGDNAASAMEMDSPGPGTTFVQTILGVDVIDADVRDEIGGQLAPLVASAAPCFDADYAVFGGCLGLNTFDSIEALPGAVNGHSFLDPSGTPYGTPGRAGSVYWDRMVGPDRKQSLTFPYGLVYVRNRIEAPPFPGVLSARSALLREIIVDCFDHPTSTVGPITDAGSTPKHFARAEIHPNPFNPSTTFRLTLGVRDEATVRLYNLRGELVKTLHAGGMDAGTHELAWNGTDDRGAAVASGVYVMKAVTNGFEVTKKAVLLK